MNRLIRKNSLHLLSVLLLSLLFISCAKNEQLAICLTGHTYGFFGGIWHGMIAPFDLIAMLIWDDVTIYAPNNNGIGYAFGFLIGSGGWGFLGGKSSRK
jgi:hypothetical protein